MRTEGPERNLLVWRTKGRLKRRDLRQLNHLLDQITRLLQRADEGSGERYYAVTTVMTPVERERS